MQQALNKEDPSLSVQEKASLASLLDKYFDVFSSDPDDLGRTNVLFHTIDIGVHGAVRQGLLRLPHDQIPVLKAEVDKLQKSTNGQNLRVSIRESYNTRTQEKRHMETMH